MIEFAFKFIEKVFRVEKAEVIKIIKESIIIFLVAAVAGFFVNMYHPRGYTFVSASMFKSKQVVQISSKEAKIKMDNGNAVVIDTRTSTEYEEAHIPGALHIPATPASLANRKIKEYFDRLQQPRELVLYCDGASCGSSPILARQLISMGYKKHIYIIEHGIPEWIEKGYPVEKKGGRK